MKKKYLLILFVLTQIFGLGCENSDDTNEPQISSSRPTIDGVMIFHNYTSYDAEDSQMWCFNFTTEKFYNLSKNWNIKHPMNAHFSPDGKKIVFMGIGAETNTWDIFLYELDGGSSPVNLTPYGNSRDEDPKFSPDGKQIAFKQDGAIAQMVLETGKVTKLTSTEYSMPYYNFDGTKLVCSKGAGSASSIVALDVNTLTITPLYNAADVQDYYPINANEKSFYYTVGYSKSNRVDQIYRGFWSGLKSELLPFNNTEGDYSDPFPVNNDWVIVSSTRPGSRGGYDLYIANTISGEVFSMSDYNSDINSSKNDLGACFWSAK